MVPMMGVDIGQKHDPSAICAVDPEYRKAEKRNNLHYTVRFLERLPLGTPYPDVARRVGKVADRIHKLTKCLPHIYVDATGVGAPVVDLLKEEARSKIFAAPPPEEQRIPTRRRKAFLRSPGHDFRQGPEFRR